MGQLLKRSNKCEAEQWKLSTVLLKSLYIVEHLEYLTRLPLYNAVCWDMRLPTPLNTHYEGQRYSFREWNAINPPHAFSEPCGLCIGTSNTELTDKIRIYCSRVWGLKNSHEGGILAAFPYQGNVEKYVIWLQYRAREEANPSTQRPSWCLLRGDYFEAATRKAFWKLTVPFLQDAWEVCMESSNQKEFS